MPRTRAPSAWVSHPFAERARALQRLSVPRDQTRDRRALALLRVMDLWTPSWLAGGEALWTCLALGSVAPAQPIDRFGGTTRQALVDHVVRATSDPLPAFLYDIITAVNAFNYREAVRAVQVLHHLGTGGALTDATSARLLSPFSERSARALWRLAPGHPIGAQVRIAQNAGFGGPAWLGERLARSLLRYLQPNEGLWSLFVGRLATQADQLDPNEVDLVVDYAVTLPGRTALTATLPTMLEEARAWQAQRRIPLDAVLPDARQVRSIFVLDGVQWAVVQLRNGRALAEESSALHHDKSSAFDRARMGLVTLWSLRRDSRRCLTLVVSSEDRTLIGAEGHNRREPTETEHRALCEWASRQQTTVRL